MISTDEDVIKILYNSIQKSIREKLLAKLFKDIIKIYNMETNKKPVTLEDIDPRWKLRKEELMKEFSEKLKELQKNNRLNIKPIYVTL